MSVTEPPQSEFDAAEDVGTATDAPTSLGHDGEPVTLTDVVSRFDDADADPTGSGSLPDRQSRHGAGTGRGTLTPHGAAFLHSAPHARAVSVAGAAHGEPVLPWAANISNLTPVWQPDRLAASARGPVRWSSFVRNVVSAVVVVGVAALAYYLGYRQSTGQQAVSVESSTATTSGDSRAPSAPQPADGAQPSGRDPGATRVPQPPPPGGRAADVPTAVEAPAPNAGSGASGRRVAGSTGAGARDASTLAASPDDAAATAAVAPAGAAARNRPVPARRAPQPVAPTAGTRTEALVGGAPVPAPVSVKDCTAAIAALGLCTPDSTTKRDSP